MDQLRARGELLSIPLALCALFLTSWLAHHVTRKEWMRQLSVVFRWLLGLGALIFNSWTLEIMHFVHRPSFITGVFILAFFVASNLVLLVYLSFSFSEVDARNWARERPLTVAAIALGSLVDLNLATVLQGTAFPGVAEFQALAGSLSLGGLYYRDIPFFVLQTWFLFGFGDTSIYVIVALLFSFFLILSFVVSEVVEWSLHFQKTKQRIFSSETLDWDPSRPASLLQFSSHPPALRDLPRFGVWLACAVFPFVLLSLTPQFLTGFGIPFARACAGRFLSHVRKARAKNVRGLPSAGTNSDDTDDSGEQQPMVPKPKVFSWYSRRGTFLLCVNIASLTIIMLTVWPVLALVALVLGLLQFFGSFCELRSLKELAKDYRFSLHWLIGQLLLCYFPFLAEAPPIFSVQQNSGAVPRWKKVVAGVWYLGFEVVLPVTNVATDFLFSLQLLRVYRDPYLDDRDVLFVWVVVSFGATCFGAFFELIKQTTELVEIGLNFQATKTVAHLLARSPLGSSVGISRLYIGLKLANALIEDMTQVIVAIFTIGFVGRVSPLWTLKVSFSLVTFSYNMSKLITDFSLGKKVFRLARLSFQLLHFVVIVLAFSVIMAYSVHDTFCDLGRSVDDENTLTQLASCLAISGNFSLREYPEPTSVALEAAELTTEFSTVRCSPLVRLDFVALRGLATRFTITENSGPQAVSFSVLLAIHSQGALVIENNTAPIQVGFPLLSAMELLALLSVSGSVEDALVFPALEDMHGTISVSATSARFVQFPLLATIEGGVLDISGNPELESIDLQSLATTSSGRVVISSNRALISLSFPSLVTHNGNLNIFDNAGLALVDLSVLSTFTEVNVAGNPTLEVLNLNATRNVARLNITDNAGLTSIHMDAWDAGSIYVVMNISRNANLRSIFMRKQDCSLKFSFVLDANPNLETVYLKRASVCHQMIVSTNNPKLEYVFV